jgi:Rrf2 family protein
MAFYGAGVEYALHTMLNLHLASPSNGLSSPSARELAEFQVLPLAFTRRLLTQLEKAGLLRAAEGIRGGWQLARDASLITVLDVVDALHEGAALFSCQDVREHCVLWAGDSAPRSASTGVCSIHAVMLSAEQAMRAELRRTTIADLGAQLTAKISAKALQAIPLWFGDQRTRRRPSESSVV